MIPGFVDLQVNGFKGIDFSDPNLKLEDIFFVSKHLAKHGILGFCPTIISSPLEVYEHNLPLIAEALQSKDGAQILGIHLEGPFINPEYGPRGVHPEDCIILPSIEIFEQFRTWSDDNIAILTLAPEREGALELIKHVVNTSKVVLSIGHLNAGKEIIQKAVDAGVQAATHIGNGLADMVHRHNNPLWPILADDRITGLLSQMARIYQSQW
ncbi:MAG: amidohydrolase family protein [Candidatus Helarchaeota archaeon]|nr:amidohydrolase family protein [Candidatus Helarchaeota archaeon]